MSLECLGVSGTSNEVPASALGLLVAREDELVSLERDGAMLSGIARRVGILVCCCALRSSILESNLLGEGPGGRRLVGFRSLVASNLGFAEFLGRWFVRSRFCRLHRF